MINPNQFGFRKSHSTSHAVNFSVKIVEEALNRNRHVLGIFIDLSKAFDTIDHEKLLTKLNRYGIRSNAHDLIKSYLSRRQQYTDVLGEKSEHLNVKYGVPTGISPWALTLLALYQRYIKMQQPRNIHNVCRRYKHIC